MAEEPSFRESGTPSPERGDNTLTLWRLRVKPAMTVWGEVPCLAVPCLVSEYQYLAFSEIVIRRGNHPLAWFQAFDDLVILWVLPPDANVAARGLGAVFREHINPLAAGLLVEGTTRNEHGLHGLAELEVEVSS